MNIVLDDLKYSNNVVLKNLIFENKIFFCFLDETGYFKRIAFDKDLINVSYDKL